jgi:ABC-type oligopeptide transport system ATPase subunit
MLNKPCGGTINLDGKNILTLKGTDLLDYRRKVQVVFQDPQAALNPRHTVMEILTEGMVYHGLCKKEERREKAVELLESVGLPGDILDRYPHEFSGGQRQRLCIARAIALKPELLICDEAVSALDLTIRAQVLDLLSELKKKLSLSIIFITHDIGVVQHVADRIIVMNKGKIVEQGAASQVLSQPKEEYTKFLMASVPKIGKPL